MSSPRLSRPRPPRTEKQQAALAEHQRESAVNLSKSIALERREERDSRPSSSSKKSLFKSLFSKKSSGGKKSRKIKTRRAHRKKTYRKRK